MYRATWAWICLGGALAAGFVLAQGVDTETRTGIELTRKMIQTNRQVIVSQAMDFTDPESEAFWPLYRDWRAKVAGLGDRRVKMVADLAENYDTLTDEQAGAVIDEWLKLEDQYQKLRKQYIKTFRKSLPDKKVMRFFQLENKMDSVIAYELAGSIPLAE